MYVQSEGHTDEHTCYNVANGAEELTWDLSMMRALVRVWYRPEAFGEG